MTVSYPPIWSLDRWRYFHVILTYIYIRNVRREQYSKFCWRDRSLLALTTDSRRLLNLEQTFLAAVSWFTLINNADILADAHTVFRDTLRSAVFGGTRIWSGVSCFRSQSVEAVWHGSRARQYRHLRVSVAGRPPCSNPARRS